MEMKSFMNKSFCMILLCAIFCFGWSTQKKVIPLAKPVIEALRQQAAICSKETGVPADMLKKLVDWSIPNELPNKKFIICVCTNTGFADENGHLNVDKVGALTPEDTSHEEFVQDIKDCNDITKENHFDTVFAMGECINKKYYFKVEN